MSACSGFSGEGVLVAALLLLLIRPLSVALAVVAISVMAHGMSAMPVMEKYYNRR